MQDEQTNGEDRGSTASGPDASENLSQPSATDAVTSKIEKEKQYGGAEVLDYINKALAADGRSQKSRADKAEAEVKRLTGEHTSLTTRFNTVSSQVSDLLKAQNEADAEKVKDDPIALGSLRARQANAAEAIRLQNEKAEQDARKAEQDARDTDIATRETALSIKLTAIATGVDEVQLARLVPDGNPDRLKEAASILKKAPATPEVDPVTGKPKPAALTTKPVTAQSTGGEGSGIRQIVERAKRRAGVIT